MHPGASAQEKAYYERNSRQLLTTWHKPGCTLTDYASRQWSGLLSTYCLPRWREFVARAERALAQRQELDYDGFTQWRIDFETRWVERSGEDFTTVTQGDPYTVARRLFEKYRAELTEPVVLTLVSTKWEQDELPCSPISWSYDASKEIQSPGVYEITFEYTQGHGPLWILRTTAIQGGKEIALDARRTSIHRNRKQTYTLDLEKLNDGQPVELLLEVDFAQTSYALGKFSIKKKAANDK